MASARADTKGMVRDRRRRNGVREKVNECEGTFVPEG